MRALAARTGGARAVCRRRRPRHGGGGPGQPVPDRGARRSSASAAISATLPTHSAAHPRDRGRRRRRPPDVLVIIDSPDFTHRVARARAAARSPRSRSSIMSRPSVWVWRPWRARAHAPLYRSCAGAAAVRAGGASRGSADRPAPMSAIRCSSEFDRLRPNAAEARAALADPPLVLVLPGSRVGEIRRLAPIFGEALALVARPPWRLRAGAADPAASRRARARSDRATGRSLRASSSTAPEKQAAFRTRARGARHIRHGHARTCARRRADGDGLQGLADRGGGGASPSRCPPRSFPT